MIYNGIDVSSHQGKIEWQKVKNNIDFVIIRAGYGFHFDNNVKYNIEQCNHYQIPCGLYWFSYAKNENDAANEAQLLLEKCKDGLIEYPLYFDFEYSSGAPNSDLNDIARCFCKTIEDAGYYAGIYASTDFIKHRYDSDIFKEFSLWVADWTNKKPEFPHHMHQYSNKGKIDGIRTEVDLNVSYLDFRKIIKDNCLNNTGKQSIDEIKKQLKTLEKMIMRGEKNGFVP